MASKGKKTGNQPGLAAQAMAGIGEVVGRAGELDLAQGSDALPRRSRSKCRVTSWPA
ncbi:MAG: hypothetical protein IPK16_24860 [Anaerolineales bacterium]|nr:hypothetical protein [Anaerolineales bacterium]